jgi:hypothetical protein
MGSISGGIARQQRAVGYDGVSAQEEVGQNPGSNAAG